MTVSSRSTKPKPALDESSFQQLLAAAYVVQEHSAVPAAPGAAGTSQVLSVIAEIQSLIRTQGLNLARSASLVAERLLSLTNASGVSISLVENGYLDCVAEAGTSVKIPGSCVSSHSLVATERLKSGGLFESEHSKTDLRLDSELCRRLGVGSLLAAPILRFAEIAGLIEVRWEQAQGFSESELRTCRLMAGLMTGTLERSIRIGNVRSVGAEPGTAQAGPVAPEEPREKPDRRRAKTEIQVHPAESTFQSEAPPAMAAQADAVCIDVKPEPEKVGFTPGAPPTCRMCGRPFSGEELFCGFCSMPRPAQNRSAQLQSKWASMWFMQRAQGALEDAPAEETSEVAAFPEESQAIEASQAAIDEQVVEPPEPDAITRILNARHAQEIDIGEPVPVEHHATASEAVVVEPGAVEIAFPFEERAPLSARTSTFAKKHWRDVTLAMVVLVLAFGLVSAWPKSSAQPTWFQALMTRWGIIQPAGHMKVFAGRPDARVWVDVHTELYYCQGEDLYGKTPDGDFTTQYNAQSDGYLPASNTVCP